MQLHAQLTRQQQPQLMVFSVLGVVGFIRTSVKGDELCRAALGTEAKSLEALGYDVTKQINLAQMFSKVAEVGKDGVKVKIHNGLGIGDAKTLDEHFMCCLVCFLCIAVKCSARNCMQKQPGHEDECSRDRSIRDHQRAQR